MLDVMWDASVLLSSHGPHLIEGGIPVPDDVQHRYWSRSQARIKGWRRVLAEWPTANPEGPAWNRFQETMHAVFTAEVLARLTGTLFEASDYRRRVHNAGPIARNIFVAQLEVRQKALTLLMEGTNLQFEQVARLDTLRRRAERWSDVLIGHLVARYGIQAYAFDVDRARDFGSEQLRTATNAAASQQLWDLYRLSLRSAFEPYNTPNDREDQFRKSIVSSLFGWLPAGSFAETGVVTSPWVHRLVRTMHTDDVQDLTTRVLRPGLRRLQDHG